MRWREVRPFCRQLFLGDVIDATYRWESIDASSDASFMNSKRLETIKKILEHPEISLYTLNAPNSELKGVTPLGVCAWMNTLPAVRRLLESGKVSVNGTDNHGATALMCQLFSAFCSLLLNAERSRRCRP